MHSLSCVGVFFHRSHLLERPPRASRIQPHIKSATSRLCTGLRGAARRYRAYSRPACRPCALATMPADANTASSTPLNRCGTSWIVLESGAACGAPPKKARNRAIVGQIIAVRISTYPFDVARGRRRRASHFGTIMSMTAAQRGAITVSSSEPKGAGRAPRHRRRRSPSGSGGHEGRPSNRSEGRVIDRATIEDEAVSVAFRRDTLTPLDDPRYALQARISLLTRSPFHRCVQRYGILQLPSIEGDAPARAKFKSDPIGSPRNSNRDAVTGRR